MKAMRDSVVPGYNLVIQNIPHVAKAARNAGQSVEIDTRLPSIALKRGEDDEFFFQEHEAQALIDTFEALPMADHVDIEDWLLWQAQDW